MQHSAVKPITPFVISEKRLEELRAQLCGLASAKTQTPDVAKAKPLLAELIALLESPAARIPADRFALDWLDASVPLSHLAEACDMQARADEAIATLRHQPGALAKLLTLYSPYSRIFIPPEELFSASPMEAYLASFWLARHVLHSFHFATEARHAFLSKTLKHPAVLANFTIGAPGFPFREEPILAGFGASYIDHTADAPLKTRIHGLLKERFGNQTVPNAPDPKKIAVITAFWRHGHVVHKSLAPYIAALRNKFHLTLIHTDPRRDRLDTEMFDAVRYVFPESGTKLNNETLFAALHPNDFAAVCFPDIGMNVFSMIYANLRIAPVQFTTYGHPVSSEAGEIDYFLGGTEAEHPDKNAASQHYSEKLVMIPGIGVQTVVPDYTKQHPEKYSAKDGKLHISCSWGNLKIHPDLLAVLREAAERSGKEIVFHFPGLKQSHGVYEPFRRALAEALGGEARIACSPEAPYAEYMVEIERCDIAVDAYPFGSYNRIVDTLVAGLPIAVWEGARAYNRIAAALLRRLGLDELIAESRDSFIALLARCFSDAPFRERLHEKPQSLDLSTRLFEPSVTAPDFVSAVETMIAEKLAPC